MCCSKLYWAVLGFTWLYWAVLGCTGLYLAVLGRPGLYWTALKCTLQGGTGLFWAVCMGLCWAILGCNELYLAVLGCTGPSGAVLDCAGLYWAVLGCIGVLDGWTWSARIIIWAFIWWPSSQARVTSANLFSLPDSPIAELTISLKSFHFRQFFSYFSSFGWHYTKVTFYPWIWGRIGQTLALS